MNLKIFPAWINPEGQKVPLIKGWYENASNDPEQIKKWQEQFRDRIKLWGIPCGEVNGIVVLDIDVKKVNGWESLNRLGFPIPNTMSQVTPSGGSHLVFQYPAGLQVGNSVNTTLGLDTRGQRGWIAYYGFTNVPIAPMPSWFLELARPEPVKPAGETFLMSPTVMEGIFQDALENIKQAAPGESNNTLNLEAFRVGQLVASGFDRTRAETELFKAAKERGKPDYEARATIKSGLDGGVKQPVTCPFPNVAPVSPTQAMSAPPVPEPPPRWTPKYLTLEDLRNKKNLKKPQLFKDWSTEDIQITTADGGTGKTTMKLMEAVCLALGEPFLGFPNVQRGKTLYITGEDTEAKLAAIIGEIMEQMGLFKNEPGNAEKVQLVLSSILIKKDSDLCLVTRSKDGFMRPNSDAMKRIMEAVEDFGPKMIVLDPITALWGSESMVNDMSSAVAKFCSELSERANACIEIINHMGKSSSQSKDMTQFAGRGGTALPSHARVARVLRLLDSEEIENLLPEPLTPHQSAMMCNISKFTDGSSVYNKPFVIVRDGYLFKRVTNMKIAETELEKELSDIERVFKFIKDERSKNRYPSQSVIVGYFSTNANPISSTRVKQALSMILYQGHLGESIKWIDNIDPNVKEKVCVITNFETKEEL